MAGRKSNAKIIGPNAYLPVERYTISHSMEWVRGAKREIRDDDGKLLNSERDFRTGIGGTYTKEQAETLKSYMQEQGIKNIKLHKLDLNFSTKCPKCEHDGTPTIYHGTGTVRVNDRHNQVNRDELRLTYNHTKTKPKTCFIGTVDLDSPIPQINLSSKLKFDCLSYARRVGDYLFKESIH